MTSERESIGVTINKNGRVNEKTAMVSDDERKAARRRNARPRAPWIWLCLAPLLVGAAPPAPPPITIAAFLMSSETGQLSPNAINNPNLLGNSIADTALIRVKVAGGRGAPSFIGARLRLIARVPRGAVMVGGGKSQAGRLILDHTVRLGPAGADGNTYAGFWLEDVGCAPIKLDVTLLTAKALHGHANLDFQCYE